VNMLPYGQGTDAQGNPFVLGILTHIKSMFNAAGGPGASMTEALAYIPWGTDTSAPGLGITGEVTLATPNGPLPRPNVHYVPDLRYWYANRDVIIQRMSVDRWADREKYTNDSYGAYISGWGAYFSTQPTEDFDIVADDVDFHRDAGQPGLQLCRGEIRFKRDVTLAESKGPNLVLGQLNWGMVKHGLFTAAGPVAQPGRIEGKIGRGNYLTWPGEWGHGSVFALDDDFAFSAAVDAKGAQQGRPAFGLSLGARTLKAGDILRYRFLISRWPVGAATSDRLDARVQAALNLAIPDSGPRLTPTQGEVTSTQVTLDLKAKDHAFRGTLEKRDVGLRVPVRVAGLNPNWTAGLWYKGVAVFAPICPDPEGYAWTSLDPVADAGDVFLGNVLVCQEADIILRALQRTGGGWDVVAHNPGERAVKITVRGAAGGPLAGWEAAAILTPGEETRWTVRGRADLAR